MMGELGYFGVVTRTLLDFIISQKIDERVGFV
jgi:hypothetical protein